MGLLVTTIIVTTINYDIIVIPLPPVVVITLVRRTPSGRTPLGYAFAALHVAR